jgi:predicted MFS family arabinose efflux permease
VTAGLLVLVYDIVKAQQYGWTSGRTLGLGALALLLLAAFVVIESRSRAPLIRLDIFRIRSLTASNTAMLFVMSGLFAMFYFASLYVQDVLGYSPLKAGLAFLPVTAGIVIGAALSQVAIKAMSARHVPLIGVVLAAGGLFLLARIPTHGKYLQDLLPGLLLLSVGMGLVFVPLTLIATTNIESEDAGLASGLLNTTQQVGGALGLAILSTLATSKTNSVVDALGHPASAAEHTAAQVDGYQVAFTTGAFLMLAAAAVVILLIRRSDVATIDEEEAVAVPV